MASEKLKNHILIDFDGPISKRESDNGIFKGIKHMLKKLKKYGFQVIVYSSKIQEAIELDVKRAGLEKYVEKSVGSGLKNAISKLNAGGKVDPELVYVISDNISDIASAQKKGYEYIGTAYDETLFEELMDEHADYIVFSPKELEMLLMRETIQDLEGRVCKKKGDGVTPIPIKSAMFVMLALIGFICIKEVLAIVLSIGVGFVYNLLPIGMVEWLSYSTYQNTASFGYVGNTGVIISGISYLVAALAFIVPAKKYIKMTAKDSYLLHPMRTSAAQYVLGALFTISLALAIQVAVAILDIAQREESYQVAASRQYSCMLGVGIVVYGVVAPLAEEVIFRGITYGLFRRYLPIPLAGIITSVFFGIYHGTVIAGIYAFVFGCVMAYFYEYYGSFWAPVAVHVLSNLVAYLGTYLFMQNTSLMQWPFVIISGVICAASAIMLRRLKK